jgi:uncharacterized protein (TIGR02145 family)
MGSAEGIVEDTRTKLQWQRCSRGQTWTGVSCTGKAQEYTWEQANKLAPDGWRLPTRDELASLVYCSSGKPAFWPASSGGNQGRLCEGDSLPPAIREDAFPNTPSKWYWSSSLDDRSPDGAWIVNFYNGHVNGNSKGFARYVRLVRGGQ